MKGSCFGFTCGPMFSLYISHAKFFLTRAMCHQIIQHNKFCLNKYLCIENQVQEEETLRKVFNLIQTRTAGFLQSVKRENSKISENIKKPTKYQSKSDTVRNSHSEVFLEKGALKICSKFTGKHPNFVPRAILIKQPWHHMITREIVT